MKAGTAQRFVFTGLLVVVAMEFGSFTTFQAIWNLAFTGKTGTTTGLITSPAPTDGPPANPTSSQLQILPSPGVTPTIHPV